MAFIQYEILYKIYADQQGLTRSNIAINDQQWKFVNFNLNENRRLVSVDSIMMPRTDFATSVQGALNAPISPRWAWRGFVLDSAMNYMRYNSRATLTGFDPPQQRTFTTNFTSLQGSSDSPIVRPDCLFIGGFTMVEVTVYFGANYTLENPYYGRLYLIWTFEV